MGILNCYGIKLSHTLQTQLDTHLVLPGASSVATADDLQQRLQPNGQLDLEPEVIVMLKKSMTWKVLQEVCDELQLFLKPIMSHLEFLVYFHLHNCEMFSKHLKSQMAKLSEQIVEESAITVIIPEGSTQVIIDPNEKLQQVILCNY